MNESDYVKIINDNLKILNESSSSRIHNLIKRAYYYSISKGILFLSSKQANTLEPISTALFPVPISAARYNHGKELAHHYNLLYEKVANDYDFLKESLKNVVSHDPFIGRLWKIYEESQTKGFKQDIVLSINRNDFMEDQIGLKQVELNTIAAGMAALSQSAADVHKHVAKQLGLSPEAIPKEMISSRLADSIILAFDLYCRRNVMTLKAVILLVVDDFESNICDQALTEVEISSKLTQECEVRRLTMANIGRNSKIDEDGRLILNDQFEVVLVYYRTGYSPQLMSSESHWEGRRLVELSRCIKCPSIGYHLAGSKKVQQALASVENLKKFIDSDSELELLLSSMAGLYSLDCNSLGDQMAAKASQSPQDFVMKPQREGGGNNIFGEALVSLLRDLENNAERAQYILMDRIKPVPSKNVILSCEDNPRVIDVVSEISFYGFVVSDENGIVSNDVCGSFVRLKYSDSDEGGIVIRRSFFSSLYLV